jgi:mono/diheme cytochrome c family protein
MKRLLLLIIIPLLMSLASPASAASAIKGKKFYQKICQDCHIRDGEGGIMGPADKKKEEWQAFFDENRHRAKPEVWEGLTRKKRKDLLLFFLNYAIDSEQPDECG